MNVLIVDDSLTVRMDLMEAFGSAGFYTEGCATLEAARTALGGTRPDLIVLDLLLPDGDGLEFLSSLEAPRPPVMLLSTEAEVGDRVRGLRIGAEEYIGKPYDRSFVVSRALELLRKETVRGTSVLLVDDSISYRKRVAERLHAVGYQVFEAQTGEEGLRMAASLRPTVILVDGELPGIRGPTVIRRVRLDAALRDTPCMLVTGGDPVEAELEALEAGANDFLLKSDDLSVLFAKLQVLVRSGGSAPSEIKSLLSPKRVVAVDDSDSYLFSLAEELRLEGYDVALAHSGEAALELLAVQPADCILLDLLMPGIGGEETCRRIKAAPVLRDTPLILLTALESDEALVSGLAAGADDYVSKSADFAVLKARVRAQLRRKQFEDDARRIRGEIRKTELAAAEARAARDLAEARAELVQELEAKNRDLEAFSYTVSHDLRAPVRVIEGYAQAIIEDYGETLESPARHYVTRIHSSAGKMTELIDDLLTLSRVGQAAMRPSEVNLSDVALSILHDLGEQDPTHDVAVSIEPNLVTTADPALARVVLVNLLSNAWKFTRGTHDPEIALVRAPDGFCVRDNGAGFPQAEADRLFEPFQRLHTTSEFPGTGIGLATVRRILEKHGGSIRAAGEPGEGATFHFVFQASSRSRGSEGA
ncbi:MAG: response regulator [Myxococcales bacterium]|nr:response regulator [Myxococcales bacterium]